MKLIIFFFVLFTIIFLFTYTPFTFWYFFLFGHLYSHQFAMRHFFNIFNDPPPPFTADWKILIKGVVISIDKYLYASRVKIDQYKRLFFVLSLSF